MKRNEQFVNCLVQLREEQKDSFAKLQNILSERFSKTEKQLQTIFTQAINKVAGTQQPDSVMSMMDEWLDKTTKQLLYPILKFQRWVVFAAAGCSLVIFLLIGYCFWLHKCLDFHADNDMKYRYLKMKGSAGEEDFKELERIFNIERNSWEMKLFRDSVQVYEQKILQRADMLEKARVHEEESVKLKEKAKRLGKK